MRAMNRDTVFSLLVLLLSVTVGWVAFGYPSDSSWFPRVLSVFLGLMAMFLLAGSRKIVNADGPDFFDSQVAQVRVAAAVFGAAVLYALAIQLLDFEVVNYVFLVAAMYLLGQRNPIVIAGVATATMLLIKLLFFVLLDVSRPQGLLF